MEVMVHVHVCTCVDYVEHSRTLNLIFVWV